MWEDLEERALCLAEYIVQTGCTVRACAANFSVSKSTVHKDLTERLPLIDKSLYSEVRGILAKNLKERHLRGGDATRRKYRLKRLNVLQENNSRACETTGDFSGGALSKDFPQVSSSAYPSG